MVPIHQRRLCSPNEGFREQLKLFFSMECRLDDSNPEYKLLKLKNLTESRYGEWVNNHDCVVFFVLLVNYDDGL